MEMIIGALVFAMEKLGSRLLDTAVDEADAGFSSALRALREKLLRKGGDDVEAAVVKLAEDPARKTVQSHLGLVLEEKGLDKDEEILEAARELLRSDEQGREILKHVDQQQHVGDGGKAAQIAGDGNSVNIG